MKSITCRHCGTPRKAEANASFWPLCPTCHRIDDPLGRIDQFLEYFVACMIALVLVLGVAYIVSDLCGLLSGEFVRTVPETRTIEFVNRP